MPSVASTSGYITYAGTALAPSAGNWQFGLFIRTEFDQQYNQLFSFTDGTNHVVGADTGELINNTEATGYIYDGNISPDAASFITGSDNTWYFVSVSHVAATSTVVFRFRKMGQPTLSTFTVTKAGGGWLNTLTAFRLLGDFFGSPTNAAVRSLWMKSSVLSDADTLTASSSLSAPAGTNLIWDPLDNHTTAGTNLGTGADGTVSGTLSTASDQPDPSLGGGGGTDTPMTISTAQVQTITRTRTAGRPRSAVATQHPGGARLGIDGAAFTVTATQAPTRTRATGRTRSATAAQVPTRTRAAARAISATAAQALTRARSLGRSVSATAAQTLTRARALGRIRTATAALAATVDAVQGAGNMALSAVAVQVPTMLRAVARAVTGTATGTAVITQTATVARSLARMVVRTTTAEPSRARALTTSRATAAAQTPTRARSAAVTHATSSAQTPEASSEASVGQRVITAVVTQLATMTRAITRALSRTITQTPLQSTKQPTVVSAAFDTTPRIIARFQDPS